MGHLDEPARTTPEPLPVKPTLPPNTLFCGACGREFNGRNARKPCLLCRAFGWHRDLEGLET
jgi:hypothetical protein